MLLELTITDFAIIDSLHLRFGPHLNVFTGETGAGKSIIVDAISALVGERVGGDVVRAGSERAIVEGVFDISRLLAQEKSATAPSARKSLRRRRRLELKRRHSPKPWRNWASTPKMAR